MRLKIILILCFVLLMNIRPYLAQEDQTPSLLLTPEAIFTEYVSIIGAKTPVEYFFLRYSDETRQLIYNDPSMADVVVYPYPEGIQNIRDHKYTGGKYYLEGNGIKPGTEEKFWSKYVLEVNSGTISEFEPYCVEDTRATLERIIENPWIIVGENPSYLCNFVTGEIGANLPEDMLYTLYISPESPVPVSVSPDGQWLAFFACQRDDADTLCKHTYVYGYHVATSTLVNTGYFEGRETIFSFDRWIDTQIIISTSEMGEYQVRKYFIADASRENSVEPAFQRFRMEAEYYDNPPRYEFTTGWEADYSLCKWVIYDVTTRSLIERDMQAVCRADRGLPTAGNAYYREVLPTDFQNPEQPTAGLIRFNPITGEYVEIYRGELEEVLWVSPDETYAFLALGSNGKIDVIPRYVGSDSALDNVTLNLVSLKTGQSLYSNPTSVGWNFDISVAARSAYTIIPLTNTSWLVVNIAPYVSEGGIEVLETTVIKLSLLQDNSVEIEPLPNLTNALLVMPNQKGILLRDTSLSPLAAINYYEIATGRILPLTHPYDPQQYGIGVKITGDRGLVFTVSQGEDYSQRQEFSVKLNFSATGDCQLTTLQGINFRAEPSADSEKTGSAAIDTVLEADGQIPGSDGFTWWRLVDAQGWVRQDLVSESEGCATLPVVALP